MKISLKIDPSYYRTVHHSICSICVIRDSVTNIVEEESEPSIGKREKRRRRQVAYRKSCPRVFSRTCTCTRLHRSASVAVVSLVRAIPQRSAETSSERSISSYDWKLLRMERRISKTRRVIVIAGIINPLP